MRLVIFGPPGAGKGTQAALLKEEYKVPHLSTGEIFRSAIQNQTPLGKKVSSILDAGELVPDETVVELVTEELSREVYQNGYILDGFPRTVPQAEAFDRFLEKRNESLDAFILLTVSEEELVSRILGRGQGRSDDTEEKIKTRLDVYRKETRPVQDHYEQQGLVRQITGSGTIDDVFNKIKDVL